MTAHPVSDAPTPRGASSTPSFSSRSADRRGTVPSAMQKSRLGRFHEDLTRASSPDDGSKVVDRRGASTRCSSHTGCVAARRAQGSVDSATAWITRHPAQMQVVLGTTTPERVAGAAQGSEIPLTRAEWYELFRASGHLVP